MPHIDITIGAHKLARKLKGVLQSHDNNKNYSLADVVEIALVEYAQKLKNNKVKGDTYVRTG